MLVSDIEKGIEKINSHEWTRTVDGLRDQVWAKIKQGKVHVISFYYDEDGFFSCEVFVGNIYKEVIFSDCIFFYWEIFEFDFDEDY